METKSMIIIEKISILQTIEDFLIDTAGFSQNVTNVVTFLFACIVLAGVIWLIQFIGHLVISGIISKTAAKTSTKWDDFLLKRHFFAWLLRFVAGAILYTLVGRIFSGYNESIVYFANLLINISLTYLGIRMVNSFLDALNDVYETKPQVKRKSIKGYVQAAKIAAYIIGIILIIAALLNKEPTNLLVGLGASAAIVSLVFKDTILGFIASIQISAQDMIRPGDWIEMISKNADGIVTEINVSTVKVQNWDNTTAMIPIYSMISESFTNWRYMYESGGRRFKRPVLLDIKSVRVTDSELMEAIMENQSVAAVADEMNALLKEWNTSGFDTNAGLFRCYLEAYLRRNPRITTNQIIMVRYLPIGENGLPLEVLAYSKHKLFSEYEHVVSDIMEHIIAMAPVFGLDIYQRPKAN